MLKIKTRRFIEYCFGIISLVYLLSLSLVFRFVYTRKTKIIFGTTPIISNKYWSKALQEIGLDSMTLMHGVYTSIQTKDDFDLYFDEIIPKIFQNNYLRTIGYAFFIWPYIMKNAKIVVMPFDGLVFNRSCRNIKYFYKFEHLLLKLNNIKAIVIPYGSDSYMYSRIKDASIQHALVSDYPLAATCEKIIENRVFFWSRYGHADVIIGMFMSLDGMPRWDVLTPMPFSIDMKQWQKKREYSKNDGKNGTVKIIHTPNHRSFKGTEFLVKAVEELKQEGFLVELILLENIQNEKVREIMQEVDILAEQFIAIAYSLSGIEGMASGLPVLANLTNETYTNTMRRYSFLGECPVLSTKPETIKENLKILITNPDLREELGKVGRKYVEKYHSYKMTQYMFTEIFKYLDGKNVDLINLFHPLKSEYVKRDYIEIPEINIRK